MDSCAPSAGGAAENVGLAFGLVTAAGLSTTLGAALAFVVPKQRGTTNYFLAGSLAAAAGVMLYVSFVEIFAQKAVAFISDCVPQESRAYLFATLCFFGGVLLTCLFDMALHAFEHWIARRSRKNAGTEGRSGDTTDDAISGSSLKSEQIVKELEQVEQQTDERGMVVPGDVETDVQAQDLGFEYEHGEQEGQMVAGIYQDHSKSQDQKALIRMGIFAGIAIAFHNFPEGLATFVATLKEPSIGAAVAVAIGIHNIPEGICVAMPIYYATGSKWKAFMWATLSGLTEIVGAFLGWIVLRKVINQLVYGILFGIVAGMMVYISLKELLPMAHRYDREDKVTTLFLAIGMIVMALSLVLFKF